MELGEIIDASGESNKTPASYLALAFGVLLPFFNINIIDRILPTICFVFVLLLFCALLKYHRTVRVDQIGFIFLFTILIAFSTNTFVYMRDNFGAVIGMYGILVSMCGAWIGDAGAYFIGVTFGRRKLSRR
jgi:phosphatidate cytidylyltransferase